jgi:hypothetical protein
MIPDNATPATETPESILEEAARVTSGDRRRDYDHATPNHARIANLWNSYLISRADRVAMISPLDVATMMILLKIARACHTPTRDSYVDIAGYAKCCSQIQGFEP